MKLRLKLIALSSVITLSACSGPRIKEVYLSTNNTPPSDKVKTYCEALGAQAYSKMMAVSRQNRLSNVQKSDYGIVNAMANSTAGLLAGNDASKAKDNAINECMLANGFKLTEVCTKNCEEAASTLKLSALNGNNENPQLTETSVSSLNAKAEELKLMSTLPGANYKMPQIIEKLESYQGALNTYKMASHCDTNLLSTANKVSMDNFKLLSEAREDQKQGIDKWSNRDFTKMKFDKYVEHLIDTYIWLNMNKENYRSSHYKCNKE